MNELYQKDGRSASIEKQMTNDYMVTFNNELGGNQMETFHTEKQAIDAAQRWIIKDYEPI